MRLMNELYWEKRFKKAVHPIFTIYQQWRQTAVRMLKKTKFEFFNKHSIPEPEKNNWNDDEVLKKTSNTVDMSESHCPSMLFCRLESPSYNLDVEPIGFEDDNNTAELLNRIGDFLKKTFDIY